MPLLNFIKGLNDQLTAIAWVRRYITSFGGDPSNITLFGESAGAIDIHTLLLSRTNYTTPIATRAIVQSGVVRVPAVQSIYSQASLVSRVMSHLQVKTVEELRRAPLDVLIEHTPSVMHATDDGVFFRKNWQSNPVPEGIESLIIGDCAFESLPWTPAVHLWSSVGIIRRIRAVIRGMYKADSFLRTYGLFWNTSDSEAQEAAFKILNDAHFAWPTDKIARSTASQGQTEVFRYAFDQESPFTFTAHHAVDLLYLFDNISPKGPVRKIPTFDSSGSESSYSEDSDNEDAFELAERDNYFQISDFSYNSERVTQAMQERWISFANGEKPWKKDMLYVFGPEGEVGRGRLRKNWRVGGGWISGEMRWRVSNLSWCIAWRWSWGMGRG